MIGSRQLVTNMGIVHILSLALSLSISLSLSLSLSKAIVGKQQQQK